MRLLRQLLWAGGCLAGGLALFTWYESRRAERESPAAGHFLEVGEFRLHCLEKGSGPPIVMIHGLGGQLRNFHYLLDDLATDHHVLLVDRPGAGYSRPYRPGIRTHARAIAALILRLGLERPLIVGHSMGGAVAVALAIEHPELVSGLDLIAPLTMVQNYVPEPFGGLAIASNWYRQLVAWQLLAPVMRFGRRAPEDPLFYPEPRPEDFDSRGGGILFGRPGHFVAASADMVFANEDLTFMQTQYAQLSQIPVRVLFGQDDRILAPGLHGSGLIAAVPGATMDLVAGGHMLPVTQPEMVARWIRKGVEEPSRLLDST